jgi:hypothetical protein
MTPRKFRSIDEYEAGEAAKLQAEHGPRLLKDTKRRRARLEALLEVPLLPGISRHAAELRKRKQLLVELRAAVRAPLVPSLEAHSLAEAALGPGAKPLTGRRSRSERIPGCPKVCQVSAKTERVAVFPQARNWRSIREIEYVSIGASWLSTTDPRTQPRIRMEAGQSSSDPLPI